MTRSMEMWPGFTDWTPPERVVELVAAIAAGELDAWSGRFFRAGKDDLDVAARHRPARARPASSGCCPTGPTTRSAEPGAESAHGREQRGRTGHLHRPAARRGCGCRSSGTRPDRRVGAVSRTAAAARGSRGRSPPRRPPPPRREDPGGAVACQSSTTRESTSPLSRSTSSPSSSTRWMAPGSSERVRVRGWSSWPCSS